MDPNSDNCSISGGAVNIDSITTLCSVETQSDQLVLTSSMARSSNPTLTIQNSTNALADGLIPPNASHNHQMDPKADNAPIGHHHHLSDVNPDTDATSAGHHGLNNVDSGAGDAGAEHHQTIGTDEAPVQHGQTIGVDIGNAPVFSGDGAQLNIQQTNAHNNAGSVLVQLDQLTNQHRTCVFAREYSRGSTEICSNMCRHRQQLWTVA